MLTLWAKLAIAAALLAVVCGVCAYGYHVIYDRGDAAGVLSQQPTISALRAQIAIDATTMQTVNAQAAANLAAATTAKQELQEAADATAAKIKANDATFNQKLAAAAKAAKTSNCITAGTPVCPALLGY